jgi:hypothetical protein
MFTRNGTAIVPLAAAEILAPHVERLLARSKR